MSTKDLIEETLEARVLALTLANTSESKISEALGVSRYAVRKIQKSEDFRERLQEINQKAVEIALGEVQRGLERMASKALRALEHGLEANDIAAVKTYFAAIGIGDKMAEKKGDTNIQILMPGQEMPKDIVVTGEEV